MAFRAGPSPASAPKARQGAAAARADAPLKRRRLRPRPRPRRDRAGALVAQPLERPHRPDCLAPPGLGEAAAGRSCLRFDRTGADCAREAKAVGYRFGTRLHSASQSRLQSQFHDSSSFKNMKFPLDTLKDVRKSSAVAQPDG